MISSISWALKNLFYKAVLYVEPEYDRISVLDHIILALKSDKSLFLGRRQGSAVQQCLIIYDLCPYESAFKIRMDAVVPFFMVQALVSFSPAVRKDMRPRRS